MPATEFESLVGKMFAGRFRIQELLGEGGMGAVYLGEHEVLHRKFAIKVIRKKLLADLSVASRFRREARAASRIEHPHITYVFDYGHSEEGLPYLAMEYVQGPSLETEMERHRPFPVKRALHILGQIAEALAAAHGNQVIHRDLKPQNIVLCTHKNDPDFVKILDFGLAKIVGSGTTGMLSQQGELLGTPHYMSPEQCSGGEVDHRSDIYTFGILAFELLAGAVPFDGSAMEIMTAHIQDEPPVASEAAGRSDFPGRMDRIIRRCLEKKPEDRYQSASELVSEIRALQQVFGDTAPIKCLPTVPAQAGRSRSRGEGYLAMAPTLSHDIPPTLVPGQLRLSEVNISRESPDAWTESTDADSKLPGDSIRLRSRALEELAYTVRDLGIGSSEISHVLAQKAEAEERGFELASSIALLEADAFEMEAASREREARLRRALSQLEHERSLLVPRGQKKTMSWDVASVRSDPENPRSRSRSGEFAMQDHRLRQRIDGLVLKMQQIMEQTERQQVSLRNRIGLKRAELEKVQQEVARCEQQLMKLLGDVRDQVEETGDPELGRLLELVGC